MEVLGKIPGLVEVESLSLGVVTTDWWSWSHPSNHSLEPLWPHSVHRPQNPCLVLVGNQEPCWNIQEALVAVRRNVLSSLGPD